MERKQQLKQLHDEEMNSLKGKNSTATTKITRSQIENNIQAQANCEYFYILTKSLYIIFFYVKFISSYKSELYFFIQLTNSTNCKIYFFI